MNSDERHVFKEDLRVIRVIFYDFFQGLSASGAVRALKIAEEDDFCGRGSGSFMRSVGESEIGGFGEVSGFSLCHGEDVVGIVARIVREEEGDRFAQEPGFVAGVSGIDDIFEGLVLGEGIFGAGVCDVFSDVVEGLFFGGGECVRDEYRGLGGAGMGEQ